MQRKDAMPCYYFHDGNKNVSDMANKIKSHYGYSPFGDSCMQTYFYSATNSPSFSSEFVDNELGLIYYNFRHYAPRNGRWLNREPFEEFVLNGEDLLSEIFSPYCFVNNAPVGNQIFWGCYLLVQRRDKMDWIGEIMGELFVKMGQNIFVYGRHLL